MSGREKVRLTVGVAFGALCAAFVFLNLGDVKVNWIVGSGSTPLIIVIVLWFLIGMATDRILVVRARKRARRPPGTQARRPPSGGS
jgi:uncharacterized integral membrane protein